MVPGGRLRVVGLTEVVSLSLSPTWGVSLIR